MGVPPKVQPMLVAFNYRKYWVTLPTHLPMLHLLLRQSRHVSSGATSWHLQPWQKQAHYQIIYNIIISDRTTHLSCFRLSSSEFMQIFGSKIQDFSLTFFPKHQFLFPDWRLSNRWSIEILKNAKNQASFMMHCKCTVTMVQLWNFSFWDWMS